MADDFPPGGGSDRWRALLRRASRHRDVALDTTRRYWRVLLVVLRRDGRAALTEISRIWRIVQTEAGRSWRAARAEAGRAWGIAGIEARRRWPRLRDGLSAGFRQARRTGARWSAGLRAVGSRGFHRLHPILVHAFAAARRRAPSSRTAGILALLLLLAGWVLWERCGFEGCPDVTHLTAYQPGGASVLLDRNGEPFADLAPMEYQVVPLDSLPAHVPAAFVAVEDKRFYEHDGIDRRRILGALWANIRAGGLVEGSSTISMQLARNLFPRRIPARERTFRRKLLEARVAQEIEERFSKDEILELYLNHIYFGGGAYGIEAAAHYHFGKSAKDLAVHEAALLAALPRAPAHYDPRRHPDPARERRNLVLTRMEQQAYLQGAEAARARARGLDVIAEPERDPDGDVFAPYFVRHVRGLLEERLGAALYDAPLRITTTLEPRAQTASEEELARQLRLVEQGAYGRFRAPRYDPGAPPEAGRTAYLQGAVVLMESRTGDVLAWVGGRDYDHSRFDRVRNARRQAGSAFKPFVYAAALEEGLSPSQPILDAPYRLALGGGRVWEPRNYSRSFEGLMSMRDALVRSKNVPSVRLAAAVGPEQVAKFAGRVGIDGEVPATPTAALGVTSLSPLEMTVAYSAFATLGSRVEPRFILRVQDEDGAVLWEPEPVRTTVVEPDIAYILTDMLRDVVDRGTGTAVRRAGFRGPAAGKTGTTSDATDVWFVGYSPDLIGTVWVGFDEVSPLPYRATGGGIAAPVWGRIMRRIHDDELRPLPSPWPAAPASVVALRVDPETGLALEDGCRPWWDEPRRELFIAGQEPISICPREEYDGLLGRVDAWLSSIFDARDRSRRFHAPPDPDLGAPRLQLRRDAPRKAPRYGDEQLDEKRRRYDERARDARNRARERRGRG